MVWFLAGGVVALSALSALYAEMRLRWRGVEQERDVYRKALVRRVEADEAMLRRHLPPVERVA